MTTLPELLRAAVERDPCQPLFIQGERRTSYGELWAASGRASRALIELGLTPGERVALALDASVEFLIAYYAIARAGGVVVPLPAETRRDPLVYALAHSGAKLAVLESDAVGYLGGQRAELPELRSLIVRGAVKPEVLGALGGLEVLPLEALDAAPDGGSPEDGVHADALLSITYTSGTTGRPKGVMLAHRNLVANLRSIIEYLGLGASDRVAMVLPFHYVYGNSVLHTHLAVGGTIVHAGSMAFPARVLEVMAAERCTGFSGVPSTFARLLGSGGLERHDLGSLRYVTQAGAAMSPELTRRLRAALPAVRVFVMYGQTEAAARLAYVPPEDLERKLGAAGKAIPGVRLEVVGPDGRSLPAREQGEVVASGENIMLGYWREPEQTRHALRSGRLHTGDVGWLDEEGFLYLVGRDSDMIKSGAHRISPQEIEVVIERLDGVRECAVLGVPDELLGQAIAVAVVPQPGRSIDRQKLLRACLEALPRYKLPTHVLSLAELPRTATGKVMRAALLPLFREPPAAARDATASPRPSAPPPPATSRGSSPSIPAQRA